MTPTLLGRWQIRFFLLATVGVVISLIVSQSIGNSVPLFALLYMLLFGLVWDVIYQFITWCQQLPKIVNNLRQPRSRRPGSVQPASVPSAFQQVIDPGHVRESTRAGTCPHWTNDSPTTLSCLLACRRAWPASLGCPSTGNSPPTCSRRGRGAGQPLLFKRGCQ